ncbi:MAG: hypothetical protein QXL91_06015, partial [Candidatus Bathyarchaeia archaeon]
MGRRYTHKPSSTYARHIKKSGKPAKVKPKARIKPKVRVKIRRVEKRRLQSKPKPMPTPPEAQRKVEIGPPPEPEPPPKLPTPPQPRPKPSEQEIIESSRAVGMLTDAERRKAMLVPVPDKGTIPTPYIDWDKIPKSCTVKDVVYFDYPRPHASEGMLKELREMFRRNRLYQNKAPVNVMIWGPKGTGK